jgi:hypothetical protein
LDDVLARAALLVEVAMDSDAISGDLIEPEIYLHPNGEYDIDRSFYETIIKPFFSAYFQEGYERAAAEYDHIYRNGLPDKPLRAEEVFSPDYISAFRTEFGLTPDEVLDSSAALMNLALEQNSVVVHTTRGEIKSRLSDGPNLSPRSSQAFINTFSIMHRPAWDTPPEGFEMRDIYPWRFRRRMSATARPIFIFGEQDKDKVIFGAGTLNVGTRYVLERTEQGQLPQQFFTTAEMRQYIGAVNSERGLVFARSVADQLREKGWQVRNEVPMTELGGSKELGDVDVLAWKSSGEIRVIECKRLQLARTVAEIAEICRRFRGEAKDELEKHVRRVKWIRNNPSGLQPIVGFSPDIARIDDMLVTNTHVPMTYLQSLPIESDKIGPLSLDRLKI